MCVAGWLSVERAEGAEGSSRGSVDAGLWFAIDPQLRAGRLYSRQPLPPVRGRPHAGHTSGLRGRCGRVLSSRSGSARAAQLTAGACAGEWPSASGGGRFLLHVARFRTAAAVLWLVWPHGAASVVSAPAWAATGVWRRRMLPPPRRPCRLHLCLLLLLRVRVASAGLFTGLDA